MSERLAASLAGPDGAPVVALGTSIGTNQGLWDPQAAAPVAAMFTGTNPEGYAGCAEAIAAMDQRESITAITAPALVLAGAEDPSTPPWQSALLASSIPGAALTMVQPAHLRFGFPAHLRHAGPRGSTHKET